MNLPDPHPQPPPMTNNMGEGAFEVARYLPITMSIMHKLLVLCCLASATFASADDPSLRAMFQTKYQVFDAAIKAGDGQSIANICNAGRFVATDVRKQHQNLTQYLKSLALNGSEVKTQVESADTLGGMAKTALRITSSRTTTEKGKSVSYQTIKTEEDTWDQTGDDWVLVGVRLTSIVTTRNGKVILHEQEVVPTDWDRYNPRRSHHA